MTDAITAEATPEPTTEPMTGQATEPTAIDPELARARETHTVEQQIEALLLVADEPVSAVGLATAVDRPVRE
ncbi:SMC-Scp complex subunit ScpB, partial [Leucobacter soli]